MKWVGTDDGGYLVRRDLNTSSMKLARGRRGVAPRARDEFFAFERVKMFAESFTKAWARGGGTLEGSGVDDVAAEGAPPICVAEYCRGAEDFRRRVAARPRPRRGYFAETSRGDGCHVDCTRGR